jgi:general secretion pathway protein E
MSEQEQTRMLAQEQAERVVQRLMRRYSADTQQPVPPSMQDSAFRHWLGLASGMPPAELTRASTTQADTRLVPLDVSRQRLCVALRAADGAIALVLADPFDRDHRLWLEARLRDAGHPRTRWYVTPVQALLGFIDRIEQSRRTDDALHTGVRQPSPDVPAEPTAALRHINGVLREALGAQATHLHWLQAAPDDQARAASGVWQMRVEGTLRRTAVPETAEPSFDAVFEALQAAATRDGHLPVVHAGRQLTVHVRVLQRTAPDGAGQRAAVLRLPALAASNHAPGLDELGHDRSTLEPMRQALQLAHGLWLVVAPPGAGKSTTLRALARELGAGSQRVLHLERPSVSELADALAQDPDHLLIDELDAPEVATLLADAVLAGRPVVLGVAAPDPGSALLRLERLGLSAPVRAATLQGMLVQRLLRLNCPACSRPVAPAQAGQPASVRGAGCPDCGHTGHMGRQVISHWLAPPPPLADWLTTPAPCRALQDAALEWVTAGLVSREEARRVAALAL